MTDSLLFSLILFSSVFVGLALYYRKPAEQRFEQKNYKELINYQSKINSLDKVVNDKYSELDYKLQCAEQIVSHYAELKSFCAQSRGGKKWYQSNCDTPASVAQEAVSHFQNEIAVLNKRKNDLIQVFENGGWRSYWGADIHSLQGQGARITRSYEEEIKIEAYNPNAQLALIQGASGRRYFTDLSFCTCPDFKKRELPCKHIYYLGRMTASPDFSAPLKIPQRGLYGLTACIAGRFNFGTHEDVRAVLQRYLVTVVSSIESVQFILEGQKSVTRRAIQKASRLGLMQISEDDLLPMLDTEFMH